MREFAATRDAGQCFASDVALPDVVMAINARSVFGFGIVEMNDANVREADVAFERFEHGIEAVFTAQIVARSKSVRGIETNA